MVSNWEPPSQILPHLFLGSYTCTHNREELLKLGIKYVLTAVFPMKMISICRYILNLTDSPNLHPNSFIYLQCPVKDSSSEDILPLFEKVFTFIDQVRIICQLGVFTFSDYLQASSNSACLIHCHVGVSRSPAFVLAYLMHKKERNLRESYELLVSARKHVSPNPGFLQQLMAFEDSLFECISINFDTDNLSD
jgi:protein-tyrosine phosphatase